MDRDFTPPVADLGRLQMLALGVGAIGAILLIIGALTGQIEQALRSYLIGFVFWVGIGIGSLGLLILQHITGGAWGVVIRRIVEAGARTLLPWGLILSIPLLAGIPYLYFGWMHPNPHDDVIAQKAPYLNYWFFLFRTVGYFLIWGGITYALTAWSRKHDETGDWRLLKRMTAFSGPIMVLFVLLVTFASVDWCMSLDPHWFSTIYGLLFLISWALSTMAFVITLLTWLQSRAPMNQVLGPRHLHDLGKLMLAFTMVLAYFNLSQYLIIWSGNLPEETTWYLTRSKGGWGVVGLILIFFHFAFPFVILLSRDIKRNFRWLYMIAIFIMIIRFVDLFYLIAPNPMASIPGSAFHISWMDFVAPFAVGGLWLWWFFGELKRRPMLPPNDPFIESAIEHGRHH
jgi:hypothetical protein